jgi:hypothetical protein
MMMWQCLSDLEQPIFLSQSVSTPSGHSLDDPWYPQTFTGTAVSQVQIIFTKSVTIVYGPGLYMNYIYDYKSRLTSVCPAGVLDM